MKIKLIAIYCWMALRHLTELNIINSSIYYATGICIQLYYDLGTFKLAQNLVNIMVLKMAAQ